MLSVGSAFLNSHKFQVTSCSECVLLFMTVCLCFISLLFHCLFIISPFLLAHCVNVDFSLSITLISSGECFFHLSLNASWTLEDNAMAFSVYDLYPLSIQKGTYIKRLSKTAKKTRH